METSPTVEAHNWEISKRDSFYYSRKRLKYYTSLNLPLTQRELEPFIHRQYQQSNVQGEETPLLENSENQSITIEPKGTLASSIFPLTNTIIGAGTLTLPFAFATTGMLLGVIVLFLVSLLCGYSAYLLIVTSEHCEGISYKDLAVTSFGKWGARTVESSLIVVGHG